MYRRDIERFFKSLDRSYFIDNESVKRYAHMDRALPIGYEQTISQPSLVLEMTCLLAPERITGFWRSEPGQVIRPHCWPSLPGRFIR